MTSYRHFTFSLIFPNGLSSGMWNTCYLFNDELKVAGEDPEKMSEESKPGHISGTFHGIWPNVIEWLWRRDEED